MKSNNNYTFFKSPKFGMTGQLDITVDQTKTTSKPKPLKDKPLKDKPIKDHPIKDHPI